MQKHGKNSLASEGRENPYPGRYGLLCWRNPIRRLKSVCSQCKSYHIEKDKTLSAPIGGLTWQFGPEISCSGVWDASFYHQTRTLPYWHKGRIYMYPVC